MKNNEAPNFLELTLIPTTKCNLRCDYCCLLDSLEDNTHQDIFRARKFLDWQLNLGKNRDKSVLIEFFGGEPTLHWEYVTSIIAYVEQHYSDRDVSFRIYTNGIWPEEVTNDLNTWKKFSDVIVSIDGTYEANLHRTKSKVLYERSINNLKRLLAIDPDFPVSAAMVIHPDSDLEENFKVFEKIGVKYYHFEIASLWNDDKDNGITNNFLLKVFRFIYDNILLKIVEDGVKRVFSIPKEFLSSKNYFKRPKHYSCFDTNRALSPTGDIFACRDLALSSIYLREKEVDKNIFFRESTTKSYHIDDLILDKETDDYSDTAREYDSITPCWIKAFEFVHLAKVNPEWLEGDFQDFIIFPLFEIMNDCFRLYHYDLWKDEEFMKIFKNKVYTYDELLECFEEFFNGSEIKGVTNDPSSQIS